MGSPKCWRIKKSPSLRKISLIFFQTSTGDVPASGYPTRMILLDWGRSRWYLGWAVDTVTLGRCSYRIPCTAWGTSISCISLVTLSGQQKCAFFLEPLQLWDAREHARKRKFFNDVNAVIALVSGMRAPCQARGEELRFDSEQCLCVRFTHTQKEQRKPEPFP